MNIVHQKRPKSSSLKKAIKAPKTPETAKRLFMPFLFPCNPDKTAYLNKGETWLYSEDQKKPLIRSTESDLCGIDLGQAGLVVIDFDVYKKEFQESKEANSLLENVHKHSQIYYKTPSGGYHYFFKGSVSSSNPFPGVDIKGKGGYVVLWNQPCPGVNLPDFETFLSVLTEWPLDDKIETKKKEHREFGPGKNNTAIPQRAGKSGYHQNTEQASKDIIEMFAKNEGREWDKDKYLKDYLANYEKNFFNQTKHLIEPQLKNHTFTEKKEDKQIQIESFTVSAEPRLWLNEQKIFIKGRANQCTGDGGVGKSTFTREYAYSLWKKGEIVVLFCQEDDEKEDIGPWLVDKGHPEGSLMQNFYLFTNWNTHPITETLALLKHIDHKFIVIDPVHAIFADITKPALCRKYLFEIQNNCTGHKDTVVYVNHPKAFWKEQKLSGSEINASTKELGRICRGCTLIKHDDDTGFNIIEHTKRQLNADRYSFNLVEDYITNKNGKQCSFSKIEDFKVLKSTSNTTNTILPTKKNLSEKRKEIRREIIGLLGQPGRTWTPRKTIEKALKAKGTVKRDIDRELSLMYQEGLLERKSKGNLREYNLKT